MKGKRIKYNNDMTGTIIDENNSHVLILFDTGIKYCVGKTGIEKKQLFDNHTRQQKLF